MMSRIYQAWQKLTTGTTDDEEALQKRCDAYDLFMSNVIDVFSTARVPWYRR